MSDVEAKLICEELGLSCEELAEESAGPGRPGKQNFRRAVAAIDKYRRESADQDRAHMLSELSNLAHGGEGS